MPAMPKPDDSKNVEIIIKPTKDCNLRCKYCYVPHNLKSDEIMSEDIFSSLLKKTSSYIGINGKANFIWHGSEPMIIGLDFYKSIVSLQKKHLNDKQYSNGIQTNGTLLDEKSISFFKDNNFGIGISLDGPQFIHDKNRVYRNGIGSFNDIMSNIKILKKTGTSFGAIAVLTKFSIIHLKEIYLFFKEKGIDWKFNPLVKSDNSLKFSDLSFSTDDYSSAFIELFDLWYQDTTCHNTIYSFENIVSNILLNSKRHPIGCNFSKSCQKDFISIEPNGDIFPCGRFENEKKLLLGNIKKTTLENVFSSDLKEKILKRADQNKDCQECEFLKICNSGCMYNAYSIDGDFMTKDSFCLGMKKIFGHVTNKIYSDLKKDIINARK